MKSKSILCLATSVIVGFALTAWFLHGGGSPPVGAPPQNTPQNTPANPPTSNKEDEAARLVQCRQALQRTARAFLAEAAVAADGIQDLGCRRDTLLIIIDMQTRQGDTAAAKTTAALMEVDRSRGFDPSRAGAVSRVRAAYYAIVVTQIEAGKLREAVRTAVELRSAWDSAELLRRILRMQRATGDHVEMRNTLTAWIGAIETQKRGLTSLQEIVDMHLQLGDRDAAVAAIESASAAMLATMNARRHNSLLQQLAEVRAVAGDVAGVKAMLAAIKPGKYPLSPVRALRLITKAQAESGDIAGAKAVVATLEERAHCSELWDDIVQAQVRAGDYAGAMATARESDVMVSLTEARVFIARAQCRAGDLAAAGATAATIMDFGDQSSIRSKIADAQANMGDFAGALATVAMIKSAETRDRAYHSLATRQVKVGAFAGARKAAVAIKAEGKRGEACLAVAKAQLAVDDHTDLGPLLEAAATLAAQLEPSHMYAFAMAQRDIARVHVDAGDVPRAKKLLRAAVTGLATIRDKHLRSHDWQQNILGKLQAEIGDFAGARATAAMIEDAPHRAGILREIAATYVRTGDATDAKALAAALGGAVILPSDTALPVKSYPVARARASQKVARAHGAGGDAASIFEAARLERDAYCRARILLCGARGLLVMAESATPVFVPPSTTLLPPTATQPPTTTLPPNRFPPAPPLPE